MTNLLPLLAQQRWAMEVPMLRQCAAIAQRYATDDDRALALVRREDRRMALDTRGGVPFGDTQYVMQRGTTAIVSVIGPMFRYANLFTNVSGATATGLLAQEIQAALDHRQIERLLLVLDSPGGAIDGIDELASLIASAGKPVIAFVDGTAASAAYWIASAADAIVTSSTGRLGSIGVVATVFRDDTEGYVEIVSRHAADKRIDIDTSHGQAVVQAEVDALETVFLDTVAGYRLLTPSDIIALHGGVRIGADAVAAGLADRTGTFESLFMEDTPMTISLSPQNRAFLQSLLTAQDGTPPPVAAPTSAPPAVPKPPPPTAPAAPAPPSPPKPDSQPDAPTADTAEEESDDAATTALLVQGLQAQARQHQTLVAVLDTMQAHLSALPTADQLAAIDQRLAALEGDQPAASAYRPADSNAPLSPAHAAQIQAMQSQPSSGVDPDFARFLVGGN